MPKKKEYVVKVKAGTELVAGDDVLHLPKDMYIVVKSDEDAKLDEIRLVDCPDGIKFQHDSIMKKLSRRLKSDDSEIYIDDKRYGRFMFHLPKCHIEWHDELSDITVEDMATSLAKKKAAKEGKA